MKLLDYENSFLSFFQGSKILQAITPHHWYTQLLWIYVLWRIWRGIKRIWKNFCNRRKNNSEIDAAIFFIILMMLFILGMALIAGFSIHPR